MDKILDLLNKLADKINQTVAELWPHAVRYVMIEALTPIVLQIVLLIVGIMGYRSRPKDEGFCGKSYPNDGPTAKGGWIIMIVITTLVLLITASLELPVALEPTGYLIENILHK